MRVSVASLLDSRTGISDINVCMGLLKWISNPTCLILISKAHKHGLTSSALKSKKNHLELTQDVKLMNTIYKLFFLQSEPYMINVCWVT